MPTTKLKNAIYEIALPVFAPNVAGKMRHVTMGRSINNFCEYEKLLERHHVLGSEMMLKCRESSSTVYTSLSEPTRKVDVNSLFRVASITKTLTALVTMRLIEKKAFALNTYVQQLIPDGKKFDTLKNVTVENILCHTSGLVDIPEYDAAVKRGNSLEEILERPAVRQYEAGTKMVYSNFAFGFMGSVLESVCRKSLSDVFDQELCQPLKIIGGFTPVENADHVVPMNHILPYKNKNTVNITALGSAKMASPDPMHHFGYTAGGFYTNCESLSHVLTMISSDGIFAGKNYLSKEAIDEITTVHSQTSERKYGLGLVIITRPDISPCEILGHQGFAYGCVDGMFLEKSTGRQIIMLNGGCSELREGRLAVSNRDFIKFGLKEMSSWQR